MGFELRKYQKDAVDAGLKFLRGKSKKPGIIVAPCGSGKSVLVSKIAIEIGKPVLVLQPSKEILEQNYAKAISFGVKPTIYSASCGIKELSTMTYATLKSIKKDVAKLKEIGIDVILIDEVHSGYSPEEGSEFMEFMKEFPDTKVLGFTATPCRLRTYSSMLEGNYSKLNMLTKDDKNFFKSIIHVTQIQELTAQGFWANLKYERWAFDDSSLVLNSAGAEFTDKSIKESIAKSGLNNTIYRRILQLMKERKHILVCMDSIESCNTISNFMNKKFGILTGVVTSETTKKKREMIINDFKSGKLKIVFNYSALSTGFDFPELDCVVFGRPTFSYSTYYQVCLDMNTEILTKRGWLKYEDMKVGDITASLKGNGIVWSTVEDVVHRCLYPGEKMIEFNNQHVNFRVTEDHDLLTSWDYRKAPYEKETAKSAMLRESGFFVPVSGNEYIEDYDGLRDCDIKLLGYIMSNGYISKNGRQCTITQSEKNMENIIDIEKTLKECGIKYGITKQRKIVKFDGYEEKDYGYVYMIYFSKGRPKKNIDNLKGFGYLSKFIDKSFPEVYEKLSKRQIEIFLSTLNAGNGSKPKTIDYNLNSYTIAMGTNTEFTNKLQSLLVRRGYRCKVRKVKGRINDQYILMAKDQNYTFISGANQGDSIKNGKRTERPKMKISETEDGEEVWCVRNNIGNIITRRNGKVVIMGNCGRAVRIHPDKKEALIIDCCDNMKRFGRIEDLTIEQFPSKGWCMFAGDQLLSNIRMGDIVTKQDILDRMQSKKKVNSDGRREGSMDDFVMWFGKYEGVRLKDVPVSYLRFLSENMDNVEPGSKMERVINYYHEVKA